MLIRDISIQGFKNHVQKVQFSFSDQSVIMADNGKGKTTMGEAISWCFFGCNMFGNESDTKLKNQKVKIMEVDIDFVDKNGEIHNLIRRRKGSKSDIFLDDMEVKNTDLVKYFTEKQIFLSIFNPEYFPSLAPKDQKKFLVKILPEVTKEEVFEELGDYFRDLLIKEKFKNPTMFLEDKRTEKEEQEKELIYLQGFRDANLSHENNKISPEKLFEKEKELAEIEKELEKINEEEFVPLHDLSELKDKQLLLEKRIMELKHQQLELADTSELNKQLIEAEMKLNTDSIKKPERKDISGLLYKRTTLLNEYKERKLELKQLDNIIECPNCETKIDLDEQRKANLINRLNQIEKEGKKVAYDIQQLQEANERIEKEYENNKKRHIEIWTKKVNEITTKVYQINQANENIQNNYDNRLREEVNKIQEEIASLNIEKLDQENKLAKAKHSQEKAERREMLKAERTALLQEQNEITAHNLQRKIMIDQLEEKRAEVQKAKDDLVKVTDRIEKLKIIIDAGKKYQQTMLELQAKIVNQYLDKVKIQLYQFVKSTGEIKETFKIQYEGKEFNILSNSERIRAGLEISNLIMGVLDLKFPIFIDNAESITSYNKPDTQIIEAKVVEGKELEVVA